MKENSFSYREKVLEEYNVLYREYIEPIKKSIESIPKSITDNIEGVSGDIRETN